MLRESAPLAATPVVPPSTAFPLSLSHSLFHSLCLSRMRSPHCAQRTPALRLSALSALIAALYAASYTAPSLAQTVPPAEYRWSALNVKAYDAHNLIDYPTGIAAPTETQGKGVTLAIIDSGVLPHTQYTARLLSGYDYFSATGNGTNDQYGHGTHVAGIAGAALDSSGMVGIAPNASILPVRVLDNLGSGTAVSIDSGVRWALANHVKAVSGVPTQKTVFNMSLGSASAFGLPTLQAIRSAGTIAVVAAGNAGGSHPLYPARYASDSSVAGWVIAVGSVDSNNVISSFSNRAGDTRNFYLVAPGYRVESTYYNNGYTLMSGTSMATPAVSGAAAVVWGAWPYLTGDKVVKSLLWSATDLGDKGVDVTYGWGLLNVAAALQPIGDTCVPTASNSGCTGTSTTTTTKGGGKTRSFATPAAAGAAAMTTTARVIGYDELGRHFSFSAAALLRPGGVGITQNLGNWMAASQPLQMVGGNGGQRFAYQGDAATGTGAFAYTMPAGSGEMMMFSGAAVLPFGASHSRYLASAFASDDALKIPYLSLVEAPSGIAYDAPLTKTVGVRVGYVAASNASQFIAPGPHELYTQRIAGGAAVGDLSARFGALELIGTIGALNEDGAFLGSRGTEPGSLRGLTRFGSLSATYEVAQGLSALASFSQGSSHGLGAAGDATYRLSTQSFSLGLVKQGVFADADRMSLAAVLPSRVASGDVTLRAAVDVNMETGAPIFGNVPVSLTPRGREQRYEWNWSTPIKGGSFGLTMMHRVQPNHDPLARSDNVFGVRLVQALR